MAKQSFPEGAFVLVIASLLVKVMGFLYQIIIIRIIGTEGIGIFNMVYPLFITALVLINAGLPLAISKYVAEEIARGGKRQAERLLGMSVSVLLILSTVGTLILILCSPYLIGKLYADTRVVPAFLVMVPSLMLIAISSAIKSYFQGLQDMRPTAITQLLEQTIRLTVGITLVIFLYPYGLVWAVVGLASAILLSEIGGFYYLCKLFKKNSYSEKLLEPPAPRILAKLFSFGIPITVTRIVTTLVTTTEASLIPHQLINAGKTLSQATSFYGELTGVAFTLLMIPSTLTFSLATTLVPAISEAQSREDKNTLSRRTSDAIGMTLIAGLPCALILFYWGEPITKLLFNASNAGYLLKMLALGSIFLYLSQTTAGILQGIGCVKTNFTTTLISGIIRLSGIYFLGSNPLSSLDGIAISYITSFTVLAILNLAIIKRKTKFSLDTIFLIRLLTTCCILAFLLHRTLFFAQKNVLFLLSFCLLNIFTYFIILFLSGDKYVRLIQQLILRSIRRT